MKKLIASSLIGSTLFTGAPEAKAFDYYGIKSLHQSLGYTIYTIDSLNSVETEKTTFCAQNWQGESGNLCNGSLSDIKVDPDDGKLIWSEKNRKKDGTTLPSKQFSLDPETNIITELGEAPINWKDSYSYEIEKPIISQKTNGEIHIGENSWITKEENGRQKVWAEDVAGNSIPIDYTNGTKLLINGRDVEQSINNVGALSAALTGLPTVPTDTTLACGLGTGTHGGDFAFSGGCASKVNEKLSINYAASLTMPGQDYAGDFEDKFSAKAGFVWQLGKSTKPSLISMKAKEKMEAKIFSLEEKNQSIISQNKSLLARLERLEKIALNKIKSKDLAVHELQ